MNLSNPALSLAAALLGIVAYAPLEGHAQGRAEAAVDKISFENLPSPDVNIGKAKNFKAKDWLEVETKINIKAAPVPVSGFLDQITVKWYVAVENAAGGRNATALLVKDVNYVNVPVGEDFYVSVYLSPSSVRRITGAERANKRSVKAVAVQILRNGQEIGRQSESSLPDNWWTSPSLGQMTGVNLLNKNETPFKSYWYDRYGEIEERQR